MSKSKELTDIYEALGVNYNLPVNQVWCRIGAYVHLPKCIKEYKTERGLANAIARAIKAGNYEVDGDSYVPEPVMSDLREENLLSFPEGKYGDGDLELGEL
jgi:hypothetical protein